MKQRIKCNGVRYRQGFIEVVPGVHPHHVNLEAWNVHPDLDISQSSLESRSIPDEAIVANVEIEVDLERAKALVKALNAAIESVERADSVLPKHSFKRTPDGAA